MTSPPRDIQVRCPQCGHLYEDWYRPSINLELDDFDDEYIEEASTATYPECGYKVDLDVLIVRKDRMREMAGAPEWGSGGSEFKSRRPDLFLFSVQSLTAIGGDLLTIW